MPGPVEFKLTGVEQMSNLVAAKGKDIGKKALSGLFKVASQVMTISKRDFAPVDEGIMRNSGVVGNPERRGKEFRIELGYGGAAEAYVVRQHEDLTLSHSVGEAKFLERPLLAYGSRAAQELAAELKL